jgi:hypothetical protein
MAPVRRKTYDRDLVSQVTDFSTVDILIGLQHHSRHGQHTTNAYGLENDFRAVALAASTASYRETVRVARI